jgi:hypothetical protein
MSSRWPLVCSVLAALAACSSDDATSELRQLIDAAAAAAEERQTNHFRGLLSATYTDVRGNDYDEMIDIVRGYFLMHPSLEVLTRIDTIELNGDDAAEISLLAGVLGQRAGASLLGGLDGRLYDLELELVQDSGEWQINGARWERSLEIWGGD